MSAPLYSRNSEVAIASLRELAGSGLYRRNAFRLTGLPADVDRRTARQRQQQLTAALRVGADLDVPGSAAAPEDLGAAFDAVLGDPRRRLVHEVFAEWGAPDGCECPAGVHHDHDAAVRVHAAALAVEPADLLAATISGAVPGQWTAAATAWTKTLRSASFWRHLHHRVERLDDKQLDSSTVDALRAELPVALVRPLLRLAGSAAYPAPLRKNLSEWPMPARERDRLIEEAAEPLYAELESAVRDLHTRLESGDADEIVTEMRAQVNPLLARLEGLAPRDQHRRTDAARDKVAVLLNNCALARSRETGQYEDKVKGWLAEAEKLATDPETQRRVRENLAGFDEADSALNQFRFTVDEIRRTRGRYEAARFLRGILSQVTDEALITAIRDMLSDLDAGAPISYHTPSRPVRYRPPSRRSPWDEDARQERWRRIGATVFVLAVIVLIIVLFRNLAGGSESDDAQIMDIHPRYANDESAVRCIADSEDWRANRTKVPIVDCAEEHWAEVIGTPKLIAPSTYPGDDQLGALSVFECLHRMTEFGLPRETYTVEALYSASESEWNAEPYGKHATCVLRRVDDARWEGQVATVTKTKAPLAVSMSLSSRDGIRYNAPVGLCVELQSVSNGADDSWPIVRCSQPHWAQLLGYKDIRGAPTSESEARSQATTACQPTLGRPIPEGYEISAVVPDWFSDVNGSYAACLVHRRDYQPFQGDLR